MIQWTRDTHAKLKELDERTKPKTENQEATSYLQGTGNTFMLANHAFNSDPQAYAAMQHQQYMQQQYMQQQGFSYGM